MKMSKELLFSITKKDLEISYFSGTGAGGQHRNKHMNCVRIKHPESGVIVTAQEERSKERNLRTAFERLTKHKKFKVWLSQKIYNSIHNKKEKSVDQIISEMMEPVNLKIEYL